MSPPTPHGVSLSAPASYGHEGDKAVLEPAIAYGDGSTTAASHSHVTEETSTQHSHVAKDDTKQSSHSTSTENGAGCCQDETKAHTHSSSKDPATSTAADEAVQAAHDDQADKNVKSSASGSENEKVTKPRALSVTNSHKSSSDDATLHDGTNVDKDAKANTSDNMTKEGDKKSDESASKTSDMAVHAE